MDTHILKELHFVSDHHFWYLGLLSQGAKRYTNHGKCRNNLAILAAHRSRVIGAHPTISHMLRVGSPYNPLTTCAAKISKKKSRPKVGPAYHQSRTNQDRYFPKNKHDNPRKSGKSRSWGFRYCLRYVLLKRC